MKAILCGYHWTGCKALMHLLNAGYEVFVYTHASPYHISDLVTLCTQLNIPFSLENISKTRLPFQPDIICSIYYRYIIKRHVIHACNGKILNLHPSLLPKYRGCSSIPWAIINGEKETGFTYHYIDEGCDTGPVILQKRITIESWDTQLTLFHRMMFTSMDYFNEAVSYVREGKPGKPQAGEPSYFKRGCPYGGIIDSKWPDEKTERFIRAMYFPPYPSAKYNGKNIMTYEQYLLVKNQ